MSSARVPARSSARSAASAVWGPTLALLAALALLLAAAPSVPRGAQPADAGELQLVARELGIAHPPGYPLYTVAAHAFGRLVVALAPDPAPSTGDLHPHPAWPYAINLLSAALAIMTLAVVAVAGRRAGGSWRGGLIAASVLATCPTFVVLGLVANIRQATALLAAICMLAAMALVGGGRLGEGGREAPDRLDGAGDRADPARGSLVGLAIAFGLAAGHHPSLVFLAGPIGLSLLAAGALHGLPAGAIGRATLAGAVAWLVPQLYLPLRDAAGAALGPGDLDEPAALWRFVTGAAFRGDLLGAAETGRLVDRARVVLDVLALQLGPAGLALCLLGAVRGFRERPFLPVALLLAGSGAITAALAIVYRAPQTVEYLMPAYAALAVLAGGGSAVLDRWAGRLADLIRRVRSVGIDRAAEGQGLDAPRRRSGFAAWLAAAAVTTALVAPALATGLPGSAIEMASAEGLDASVEIALAAAACAEPPGTTTILSAWHFATPLWLAVEPGARNRIRYVAPDWTTGDPIGLTWAKELDRAGGGRGGGGAKTEGAGDDEGVGGAVILTNRTREIIDSGQPLWPLRGTPFFTDRPDAGCDPAAAVIAGPTSARAGASAVARIPTGGAIELDLDASAIERHGGRAEAWIELRPLESEAADGRSRLIEPLSISVRLVAPTDGTIWAQADRTFEASRWNDPRGIALRLSLVPSAGEVPERLDADVLLYRQTAAGPTPVPWSGERETISLGVLDARGWARPPHAPGAIPFGDAMVLEDSRIVVGEDAARVELAWRARRAFVSDYTVSVHASGDGWLAQHDGTPALGALPTLKWLPGWRVRDVHVVPLPEGRPANGPVTITVSVYDAFSLEPLPVTDPDRVRAGQGERATIFVGSER